MSKHKIYLIYRFPLVCHHHGKNIHVTKVTNFISLVDHLNKHKKMNIIVWFHLANIPLFYVYVNPRQNNVAKHNFCILFIYLFLLSPTNVENFKHIYDDIFINNNYLFPYPNINCFLFLLLSIEKLD